MLGSQKLRFEPKVLLDYVSPHGPQATDVRGSLIVAAVNLVKTLGHYERYLRLLPPQHHEAVLYSLASSWVPAIHNTVHCETIDALQLSEGELARMGELLGAHLSDNLFATLLRTARSAGADAGVWLLLKQADRFFQRVYQGGGCTVLQTGPKDAVFEAHGLPFAESAVFRVMHGAFLRGATLMIAKTCVAKLARAREPRPGTVAISLSWV